MDTSFMESRSKASEELDHDLRKDYKPFRKSSEYSYISSTQSKRDSLAHTRVLSVHPEDAGSSGCEQVTEDCLSWSNKMNFRRETKSPAFGATRGFGHLPDCTPSTDSLPFGRSSAKKQPLNRNTFILMRSKTVLPSDSETEQDAQKSDRSNMPKRKYRSKKAKRKKCEKECTTMYLYSPVTNNQYFGKRKRSSTITMHSEDLSMSHTSKTAKGSNSTNNTKQNEADAHNRMECDETSSLSDASTFSDYDPRMFEADDEQSDFFEASLTNLNIQQRKNNAIPSSGRSSAEPMAVCNYNRSGPIAIRNSASGENKGFSSSATGSVPSTASGSSSVVWKKRRKNHENKFYNS